MMRTGVGRTLVLLVVAVMAQAAFGQTPGKITKVRVYQGQALVTRTVQFEAKTGAQDVLVTGLPELIVPDSLYATGAKDLSIRAVRFRMTATAEAPRPEVRKLDEEIKQLERSLLKAEGELAVLEARGEFLDSLEKFAATKVTDELNKGTLNPGAIQETAKFIFEQRDQTATKNLELQNQQEDLQEQLSVLQRKRGELTGRASSHEREAVVFVDAAKTGAASLELSYLVGGVGWSPAYSARLAPKRDRMTLEYHAALTQMSGEDWPDVELILSTSHPRMLAAAPVLSPLRISLVPKERALAAAMQAVDAYSAKRRELQQQIRGPRATRAPGKPQRVAQPGMMGAGMGGMGMGPGGMAPAPPAQRGMLPIDDGTLYANLYAAQLQNMELAAPDEVVKLSRAMGAQATEGLAVDYPIPGKISIQSRKDQQMFQLAELDLKAKFSYSAVPLLTDYVYQSVESVNTSEYPLLPGPYNAYVEGSFAGRGSIPLIARGQGMTIGFGTETQLRGSRELVEKSTSVRGGNQVVQYTYRLALRNYMAKPAEVRMWDRLPEAPDKQVTVQLIDPDPALSQDALYVAQQRPRGLLRWDTKVPANASGAKAYSFTYQFQVEFDKSFDIGELPESTAEAIQKDMQMMRGAMAAPSVAPQK